MAAIRCLILLSKHFQLTSFLSSIFRQDFNINQLIKHRNDLKLKMDKIKEDMENGLVDDKEKLKFLALMGSQIFKVFFQSLRSIFGFCYFFLMKLISETSKSFKKRQDHHTVDQTLWKLGVGPPKGQREFWKEEEISQLYRRRTEDASIIIVGSRKAKKKNIKKYSTTHREWKEETTHIKTKREKRDV